MTPLLALYGIRKCYGERTLFDIDQLQIQPASATVLTGPNGSGKSTLLRILGGLEPAEIGRAEFNGEPISFTPYPKALRDAVVYVHQHPVMFSTNVASNIGYGLRLRGISGNELERQVDDALAWAGISHLRDRQATKLSGGEKQRVALARAKVLRPRLLLLDEPTSSLDSAASAQVTALIPALIAEGHSILMACHDTALIALPELEHLDLRDGHLGTLTH